MTIGIVGLGYVGLPLATAFAEAGHEVIGVDVDPRRVAAVNQGYSHVEDVSSARLRGVEDRLVATTSYAELDRAEAILVCVPTPLSANREPELGLLENIFRSVNIALVNELAVLADRMGIDVWEVIDAAATKPYGFMRFDPGPGMGGHCLPVDPFYLAWRAREYDFVPEFVELAGKINQAMPYVCVDRIVRALNDAGKAVRGSRVAVLGVAYKPGVGDTRESPALKILELLRGGGGELVYHDPHVPELPQFGLSTSDLDTALTDA